MNRVLVCGGRAYSEYDALAKVLDELAPVHIAQGGANGADMLARRYAQQNELTCTTYPAKWNVYTKSAGPIRNTQMLTDFKPDVVVACPGGRGTADMVRKAERAGVPVIQVPATPAEILAVLAPGTTTQTGEAE